MANVSSTSPTTLNSSVSTSLSNAVNAAVNAVNTTVNAGVATNTTLALGVPATTQAPGLDDEEVLAISGASVAAFLLLMVVIIVALKWWGARALGKSIEAGIEQFDEHYLGVNVEIDDLVVNAARGIISLSSLTVKNPPVHYYSQHLAKVGQVTLDLGMMPTLCSFGKKVVIDRVILKGCDLIYETKFTTSNLNDVIDHLNGDHHTQQEGAVHPVEKEAAAARKGWADRLTGCCKRRPPPAGEARDPLAPVEGAAAEGNYSALPTDAAGKKKKPKDEDKMKVVVKEVLLEDISVKIAVNAFHGAGSYTTVADIKFEDLSKEMGDMGTAAGISYVLNLILKSVAKSAYANVMGKQMADAKFHGV